MKRRLSFLIGFLVIAHAFGQIELRKAKALAKTLVNTYLECGNSPPGISIAMLKDGKIIYAQGFGYSDIESKKRVTTETKFRAASVSKMMTVTAMAKLVQGNKLDLDLPIQTYVPEFPEKLYPITPRLVSGHLSGISHYSSYDRREKRFYESVDESLKVFSHLDLRFAPGTDARYSTYGYTLLSAVVEGASGLPFLEYLEKEIFCPLKMSSTGPHLIDTEIDDMTELYSIDGTGEISKIQSPEDPSYKWGGGGMISTPSDLVRMGNAYLNGFFRSEIVDEMVKSQKLVTGKETAIGVGWRRSWDIRGRRIFEHAGSMGGARSVICVFPEQNFSIAIMANARRPHRIEEMAHVLALPFLEKRFPEQPPSGRGTVTFGISDGEKVIQKEGEVILDGSKDRIVVDEGEGKSKTYKMTYLQRENLYVINTPDGMLFTTIEIGENEIIGKSIRYGGPLNVPPTFENPYLFFEGKFIKI
ncbi:MAG: serine hydrolase domain-containing protein [Bacteroidota bacterium]